MSTLVSLVERAADLLAPIDGLHWRQLLNGKWMATDGTGLKVLIPELPAAHNGYIELYRNQELAVFQYEPDKNSDAVVSKLNHLRLKAEGSSARLKAPEARPARYYSVTLN